jgi:hypothetical protein
MAEEISREEPRASSLLAWAEENPKALLVALLVLAIPYLITCSGLAILMATTLVGGGGCG